MPGFSNGTSFTDHAGKKKCTCCPFGHHVDVDFLDFLNNANNQQSLSSLKRIHGQPKSLSTSTSLNFNIGQQDANHNYHIKNGEQSEPKLQRWHFSSQSKSSTMPSFPKQRSASALGHYSLPKQHGRGAMSDTEDYEDEPSRISHLEGQRRLTRSVDPSPVEEDAADNLPKSFSFQQIRDLFEKNATENGPPSFTKSTSLGEIGTVSDNMMKETKSESFYEIHDMLKHIESESIASAAQKLSGTFSFQDDVFANALTPTGRPTPTAKRFPSTVSDSQLMAKQRLSSTPIREKDGKWTPRFYKTKANLVLSASSLTEVENEEPTESLVKDRVKFLTQKSSYDNITVNGATPAITPAIPQRPNLLNEATTRASRGSTPVTAVSESRTSRGSTPVPTLNETVSANLIPRSTSLLQQLPTPPKVATRDCGTMFSPSSPKRQDRHHLEEPLQSTAVHLPVPATAKIHAGSRDVSIGVNFTDKKPVLMDQAISVKMSNGDSRTTLLESFRQNLTKNDFQMAIKQMLKAEVKSCGTQSAPSLSDKGCNYNEMKPVLSRGCGSDSIFDKPVVKRNAQVQVLPNTRHSSTGTVVVNQMFSSTQTGAAQQWHKTTNTLRPMHYQASTNTELSHLNTSSCQTDVKIFLATEALTSIGTSTTTFPQHSTVTPHIPIITTDAAVSADLTNEPRKNVRSKGVGGSSIEEVKMTTRCVGGSPIEMASTGLMAEPELASVNLMTLETELDEVMTQTDDEIIEPGREVVTQTDIVRLENELKIKQIHIQTQTTVEPEKTVTVMEDKGLVTEERNTSVCAVCQQEFESITTSDEEEDEDEDIIHDTVVAERAEVPNIAQRGFVAAIESVETADIPHTKTELEQRVSPIMHSPGATTERSVTTITVTQSTRLTAEDLMKPRESDEAESDMYFTYPPGPLANIDFNATPLKPILKKSRSDPGSDPEGSFRSAMTSVSFADDVTGGFTSSSDSSEGGEEDEHDLEKHGEASDSSEDSFVEATYDIGNEQGKVEFSFTENYQLDDRIPDQSIRETFELPEDVVAACKLLAESIDEDKDMTNEDETSAWETVRRQWFAVTSEKLANPYQVEDYLSSFNEFSRDLLKQVVNLTDANGNTALHYAISHCNFELVGLLLDSEMIDINQQNKAGYSAIMLAALASVQTEEDKKVIRRLFQEGNVNLSAAGTRQTALMLAATHGKEDAAELLLMNHADINAQDVDGSTALICAADHGHLEVARILLSHPECNVSLEDNDGQNALAIAVESDHPEVGVLIYAHLNYRKAV